MRRRNERKNSDERASKSSSNQAGGKPIVVLGCEWTACVVVGKTAKPALALLEFWSRKAPEASSARVQAAKMLERVARKWGKHALHIFDSGYAGGAWLEVMWKYQLPFLIRWKQGQMGKQKRSGGQRMIWDERNRRLCQTGIVAVQVRHPSYPGAVWVLLVRRGGAPWYLVTTGCLETAEQAWGCFHAYGRRWQVETVFRFEKSELAIEPIGVWKREKRNTLFHLLSVVHAGLFHLLDEEYQELIHCIVRQYSHRTGKKQRQAKVPI
jgi:hypothetical protein